VIDVDELLHQVREEYRLSLPERPGRGTSHGVVVEVDFDDTTISITFDPSTYRVTHTDQLDAAVVGAHRVARRAAIDGRERAVREVSRRCGIVDEDWPANPDRVRRHAERVAAETMTCAEDGVCVVVGADGFLVDVRIDALARRGRTPEELAELLTTVVHRAEQAARRRRAEIWGRS
jgi:hypothetical protein